MGHTIVKIIADHLKPNLIWCLCIPICAEFRFLCFHLPAQGPNGLLVRHLKYYVFGIGILVHGQVHPDWGPCKNDSGCQIDNAERMLDNFLIGFKRVFADSKNVILLSLLIEHKILGRDEVMIICSIEVGQDKGEIYRSNSIGNEGKAWLRICGLVIGNGQSLVESSSERPLHADLW